MSFFEPPPPPPEPPPPMHMPEWVGPPENVLGGVVALGLLAARSDDAAVWLESATAYPTGVQLALAVRWRQEVQAVVARAMWPHEPVPTGELPAELFRAGFELADGSKAIWLGQGGPGPVAMALRPDESPRGPLLMPRGGGGGSLAWSQGLWLWPLPPEGPLTFVCEWPAVGIALTRTELDAGAIRAAANRSRTLWDADPGASPPGPSAIPPSG